MYRTRGYQALSRARRALHVDARVTQGAKGEVASSNGRHAQTGKSHAIVSLSGTDRVGIVRDFSSTLASHGANVEESRMAILAGDFAMIVHVSVPIDKEVDAVSADIEKAFPGFHIVTRLTETPKEAKEGKELHTWTLSLEGPDQPGVMAAVTQVLATHGANVHAVETETTSAPFAGYPLFIMDAEFGLQDSHIDKLTTALSDVEERFGADIAITQSD